MPDHSVVHRYARCLSYPEWGVGTVTGIYFTGEGDDVQQWARVQFQPGVRTVPAGSLQFVDFSKPDPGAERVQRFMTAAQHAMAEGNFTLAAQRLIYARDAEPRQRRGAAAHDARVLAGAATCPPPAAPCATGRASRATARRRTASPRASTRTWARIDLAAEAADRAAERAPRDADAWERVGRLRLRLMRSRRRDRGARARAARSGRASTGLLDLALAYQLAGDLGGEVTACEQATCAGRPTARPRWSRYAHALARTDRVSEAIDGCERALELAPDDAEVADLLERLRDALPRVLPAA